MRNDILIIFCCLVMAGCSATSNSSNNTTMNTKDYIQIPADKSIVGYEGKKVWFVGKKAEMVHQHMIKGPSPDGEEKSIYIDYNGGHQTVGYYREIKVPEDQKEHKYYGTIDKMTGAGKGGGTHTEYYIDLDKVE